MQPKRSKTFRQTGTGQRQVKIQPKSVVSERSKSTTPHAEVGKTFRAARKLLGWSQEEFAAKAGVAIGTIKRAEAGRSGFPRTDKELLDAINKARADTKPPIEPLVLPYPSQNIGESKIQASKDTLPICGSPTPLELAEAGVFAIRQTLHRILTEFEDDPDTATRPTLDIPTGKKAIAIDVVAEHEFANRLRHYDNERYKSIEVTGEERFTKEAANYTDRLGTFVLVDALDGSDLAERGLSNWCSAAVFFEPSRSAERIRAAVVGIPPNHVYFATADDPQVRVYRNLPKLNGIILPKTDYKPEPVTGLPPARLLPNASIYFYGQKVENFVTVAQHPLWHKLRNETYKNLRVFNLGGIPMLVRMCDHQVKQARGVDAVIELKGQKPHDAVPGLFFAVKAGATVLSLAAHDFGSPLTLPKLEQLLFTPKTPAVKYLAATSQQLADELLSELKP